MKTVILFLFSFIAITAHSQVAGDTLIGKKWVRDSVVAPVQKMASNNDTAVTNHRLRLATLDAAKPLTFTQGAQVAQTMRQFYATYDLTSDSLVLNFSNAGFTTILSKQLSADSPTEVLLYKLLSMTNTTATVKVFKIVNTTVNLTGTTVAPVAPAGPSVSGGKVYLSVWGY